MRNFCRSFWMKLKPYRFLTMEVQGDGKQGAAAGKEYSE